MMDKPFGEVDSSIYIHIFQRFMYLVEKGEWVDCHVAEFTIDTALSVLTLS